MPRRLDSVQVKCTRYDVSYIPKPLKVGAASFNRLASTHGVEVFSLSVFEIDKRLEELGASPSTPDTLYSIRMDNSLSGQKRIEKELLIQDDP